MFQITISYRVTKSLKKKLKNYKMCSQNVKQHLTFSWKWLNRVIKICMSLVAKKGHNLKHLLPNNCLKIVYGRVVIIYTRFRIYKPIKKQKIQSFWIITTCMSNSWFKKFELFITLITFNFDCCFIFYCFFVVCFDRMGIVILNCGYFRNKH